MLDRRTPEFRPILNPIDHSCSMPWRKRVGHPLHQRRHLRHMPEPATSYPGRWSDTRCYAAPTPEISRAMTYATPAANPPTSMVWPALFSGATPVNLPLNQPKTPRAIRVMTAEMIKDWVVEIGKKYGRSGMIPPVLSSIRVRIASRRKKAAHSHRDGASRHLGKTADHDEPVIRDRPGKSGGQRKRHRQAVGHADDDIANRL